MKNESPLDVLMMKGLQKARRGEMPISLNFPLRRADTPSNDEYAPTIPITTSSKEGAALFFLGVPDYD